MKHLAFIYATIIQTQGKMKHHNRINDHKILTDNLPQVLDLTNNAVNSNDSKPNNAHVLIYEDKANITLIQTQLKMMDKLIAMPS